VAQVGVLAPLARIGHILRILELLWNVEHRQQHILLQLVVLHLLQYLGDGGECFRYIGKERLHRPLILEIELVVGKLTVDVFQSPRRLVDAHTFLHTLKDLLRLRVLLVQVIDIVRREIFHAMLACQVEQHAVQVLFLLQSMVEKLHVEILPELLFPPEERLLGLFLAHVQNQVWHFTAQSARGGYEPFLVLQEHLAVNARHIIEPF